MKLSIEVDNSLTDLSAQVRRSTFLAIPAVAKSGFNPSDRHVTVSADFVKAFTLTLVPDAARAADTLFVSPGVKSEFYSGTTELTV